MLTSIASSFVRDVLPPIVMVATSAASVATFMFASAFTLEQVGQAARNSSVTSAIRVYAAPQLRSLEAHELDASRTVPVVVDMTKKGGPQTISVTGSYTHSVAVESLRVRIGPNRTARQVGALAGGEKVTVVDEKAGWLQIVSGTGVRGWVYHKFLRAAEPVDQANIAN